MGKSRKRKQHKQSSEYRGSKGVLTSLRGGFQSVAGTGSSKLSKRKLPRLWDLLFWLFVAAALFFFAYRRLR
jgi:hypothetical protein